MIKLDGGGSFILNVNGADVATTSENRRINTIITFGDNNVRAKNPYLKPAVALKRGCRFVEHNKWLQWQLNALGFVCEIDGSFGPATEQMVKEFQKSVGLDPDGSVGRLTRAALTK